MAKKLQWEIRNGNSIHAHVETNTRQNAVAIAEANWLRNNTFEEEIFLSIPEFTAHKIVDKQRFQQAYALI